MNDQRRRPPGVIPAVTDATMTDGLGVTEPAPPTMTWYSAISERDGTAVWISRRAAGKLTVTRRINTIAAGIALLIVLTTALLPQVRQSWALITLAMVAMSVCVIVSMRTPQADPTTPPEPVNPAPLALAEAALAQIPNPTPAPDNAPEPERT